MQVEMNWGKRAEVMTKVEFLVADITCKATVFRLDPGFEKGSFD